MPITDSDLELARERVRQRLGLPALRRTRCDILGINLLHGIPPTPSMIPSTGSRDLAVIGINRMRHPLDYGCTNLADARAYHERLAARGERDES